MEIVLQVPDCLVARLVASSASPSAAVLEALGIDAYRQGRVTGFELRDLLGLPTRAALDAVLKAHSVMLEYSVAEWQAEEAVIEAVRRPGPHAL